MLEIARELIADQRKSLHALIAEQQQAMLRAHMRRRPPPDAPPPPPPSIPPTATEGLFSSVDELGTSAGPALRALGSSDPNPNPRRSSRASARPRPY